MIKVESFENELLASKCYVVIDEVSKSCLVIDPASKECLKEIELIERLGLKLEYIIITHEHTDHCWGVNALKRMYPDSKIVYSEACNNNIKKANRIFFQFYFDNLDEYDDVLPPDVIIKTSDDFILWGNNKVQFILTPGHSLGSMCIELKGILFTGDTLTPFPPVFSGSGRNKEDWEKSVKQVLSKFSKSALLYPGHGNILTLEDWEKQNGVFLYS